MVGTHPGDKFGKLTAMRKTSQGKWLFSCDCGSIVERAVDDVKKSVVDGYTPACKDCNAISKRKFNLVDYTGQQFGELTALYPSNTRRGSFQKWVFLCTCGRKVIRVPADVRVVSERGERPACSDCRKPSRCIEDDMVVVRRVFTNYRNGARVRGIAFALSIEQVETLIRGNCFYCGQPPSRKVQRGPKSREMLVNGIDRCHNDIGYVPSNVVSCCQQCNYAKRSTPLDEWLGWINRIAEYRK